MLARRDRGSVIAMRMTSSRSYKQNPPILLVVFGKSKNSYYPVRIVSRRHLGVSLFSLRPSRWLSSVRAHFIIVSLSDINLSPCFSFIDRSDGERNQLALKGSPSPQRADAPWTQNPRGPKVGTAWRVDLGEDHIALLSKRGKKLVPFDRRLLRAPQLPGGPKRALSLS